MKTFFHELPQSEIDKLREDKVTWEYVIEKYSQPEWCGYAQALDPLGCWSLCHLAPNGLRTKISVEYCKECPEFKTNQNE